MEKIILTKSQDIRKLFSSRFEIYSSLAAIERLVNPSIVILVSFSEIIYKVLLKKHQFLNVHNSLLPRYRGRHSFSWAIINGEKELGYTLHLCNERIDAGDIVSQVKFSLPRDEDVNDAFRKGKKVLRQWLPKAIKEFNLKKRYLVQDESKSSVFIRRGDSDSCIDWRKSSLEIHNLIRALAVPYTKGAFAFWGKKKIRILKSQLCLAGKSKGVPGEIIDKERNVIYVKTGRGVIGIKKIAFSKRNNKVFEQFKVFEKFRIK